MTSPRTGFELNAVVVNTNHREEFKNRVSPTDEVTLAREQTTIGRPVDTNIFEPAREAFSVGTMLAGRYRIVSTTYGGMGRVYFADDLENGENGVPMRVAIKSVPDYSEWKTGELSKGRAADAVVYTSQMSRFRREALTWIRLGLHPNIIWAICVLDIGQKPYLVMEYADGGDLRARLDRGRLALPVALNFGLQFCEGMKYAFRAGNIVHRDIKPQNVLIKGEQFLKISDFGLAKAFDPYADAPGEASPPSLDLAAESNIAMGTAGYTAPEQLKGLRYADTRSDIFSFGAMFYEMVTGQRLFNGKSLRAFLDHTVRPPSAHEIDRSVPAGLSVVLARCIEHDPAQRYASFEELSTALSSVGMAIGGVLPLPTDPAHLRRAALQTPSLELLSETYTLISLGSYEKALACAAKAIQIDPGERRTLDQQVQSAQRAWRLSIRPVVRP